LGLLSLLLLRLAPLLPPVGPSDSPFRLRLGRLFSSGVSIAMSALLSPPSVVPRAGGVGVGDASAGGGEGVSCEACWRWAASVERIAAIDDRQELLDYLAHAQLVGINSPIGMAIYPDAKRPDLYTVWMGQSGLAMPDRDYYLKDDARFAEMRTKYEAYVADILALTGHQDAKAAARRVLDFETRLARVSWAPVELRDVTKTYNPFDVAGATRATPGLDWGAYLGALGIRGQDQLVVGQPSYFADLGKALDEVRKAEYRRLSGQDRSYIKGQKYTLLSHRENLTPAGRQNLKKLLAANKRLNTAYLLKESFGQLWDYESEGWARRFFENWRQSLKWQRLPQYEKFAEMIERH
jgi:hypothetical protein